MIRFVLNEYTRSVLISKSKKESPDRFAKRVESKAKIDLERVGLLELESGSDDLYLYFKVKDYRVSLVILEFKKVLDSYLVGKFKNDPSKAVSKALTHALRYNQIKTSCSCPDFKYRFSYMATKKKYNADDPPGEHREATHTNPNNKGGLCKHQLAVLNAPSVWKSKVVTSLTRYARR